MRGVVFPDFTPSRGSGVTSRAAKKLRQVAALQSMTLRTLIKRSLRFHWRSHLGVVIGAAIGSAALIGALIVGDSVKGSLRERALERLGSAHYAMSSGDRLIGRHVAADMRYVLTNSSSFRSGGRFGGALLLSATATVPSGDRRANLVNVIGLTTEFSDLAGFKTKANLHEHGVCLNKMLAAQLGVDFGDTVLLRVRKASALGADSPLTPESQSVATIRLVVQDIIPGSSGGDFNIFGSATPPLNAFVLLPSLRTAIGGSDVVNLVLMGDATTTLGIRAVGSLESRVRHSREDWFGVPSEIVRACSITGSVAVIDDKSIVPIAGEEADIRPRSLQLRSVWRLNDLQLESRVSADADQMELRSERVFLDSAVEKAVHAEPMFAFLLRGSKPGFDFTKLDEATYISTNWGPLFSSNAQPLLTYLVNLITAGTNATPYSMVTAAGAPWTPPGLRDDEIVLNHWLADDLQAKPGDELTLVYFDPESGARLAERTNTFRVHSIVPMTMPWADRTLMPQFPGIEKAETTAEWDTSFPLVHKIRPQDDEYWSDHRGTPKAFITLAAGQKMWANRFGNLTAIRFPIPTNVVAADVS